MLSARIEISSMSEHLSIFQWSLQRQEDHNHFWASNLSLCFKLKGGIGPLPPGSWESENLWNKLYYVKQRLSNAFAQRGKEGRGRHCCTHPHSCQKRIFSWVPGVSAETKSREARQSCCCRRRYRPRNLWNAKKEGAQRKLLPDTTYLKSLFRNEIEYYCKQYNS